MVQALSRFSHSLLLACLLHAGIVAGFLSLPHSKPSTENRSATEAREIELDWELTSALRHDEAPQTAEVSGEVQQAFSSERAGRRLRPSPVAAPSSTTKDLGVPPETIVASAEGASAEAGDAVGTAPVVLATAEISSKVDLGLDGRLIRDLYAQNERNRGTLRKKRNTGEELSHRLNASLTKEDVRRGYARGNVFIAALNSAVQTQGPIGGSATIQLTINSSGEVRGLELLASSGGDWTTAIQAFREQARATRLKLPEGAQGMRVTLNVSTKIQRTSGKETDAGAVNLKYPSLDTGGLALLGSFDVADLANKSSRVVYSRVVSEELL